MEVIVIGYIEPVMTDGFSVLLGCVAAGYTYNQYLNVVRYDDSKHYDIFIVTYHQYSMTEAMYHTKQ